MERNAILSCKRYNSNSAGNNCSSLGQGPRQKKLKETCADFESMFMYYMLKTLRKTVPTGGIFPQSNQRDNSYAMYFDQKVAEYMSRKGGGIGLQGMLSNKLNELNRGVEK